MLNRRQFLQSALAGCGVAVTASSAPSLLLAAVPSTVQLHSRTQLFMGTTVSIHVVERNALLAREGMEAAFALGGRLAGQLTRFVPDSPLARLNGQGRLDDAPQELCHVLAQAQAMHQRTDGAFDMTVLPLIELFEAHRNTRGRMLLDGRELAQTLRLVGQERFEMQGGDLRLARKGMRLTLDGIAKGHIAQRMSDALSAAGLGNHLVNAGGDMVARGLREDGRPWRVGVENPLRPGRVVQTLDFAGGGAVATSGSYAVFYDAAHTRSHLVNPATGGNSGVAAVTVAARDGLVADALATALSVMPEQQALALADSMDGCACLLVCHDGSLLASHRWQGR